MRVIDEILLALKEGPQTISDLRTIAPSRQAAIQSIYRLRERGHEIITTQPGSRKGETAYRLERLAGDLRPWNEVRKEEQT